MCYTCQWAPSTRHRKNSNSFGSLLRMYWSKPHEWSKMTPFRACRSRSRHINNRKILWALSRHNISSKPYVTLRAHPHPTEKIPCEKSFFVVAIFVTKIPICHISDIIFFGISEYWPVWIKFCLMLLLLVFPIHIFACGSICPIGEGVSSYLYKFQSGRYLTFSRVRMSKVLGQRAGNSAATSLCNSRFSTDLRSICWWENISRSSRGLGSRICIFWNRDTSHFLNSLCLSKGEMSAFCQQ